MRSNTSRRIASGGLLRLVEHDARGRLQPLLFIGRERRDRVVMFAQRRGQRARVEDGLPGAVGAARHHRMRGVAEQRDAAKAPARQRILVDHREFQHAVGGADESRHVEPVEMPVGECGDEIVERARPVPVALAVVRRLDLGDPVDELQPVGVGTADRIDHHLAMRSQPARTMLAPDSIGFQRVTPRHMLTPE